MDPSREAKGRSKTIQSDWHPIVTAPFNRDLELAVFDAAGRPHRLRLPLSPRAPWMGRGKDDSAGHRPPHALVQVG